MGRLKVSYRSPAELRPRARNPRTHTKKQIRQIADSIARFGFKIPVLIDGEDGIVAGHARIEGAKLLGLDEVPVIRLEDLSEAEIRAFVIADNRLAELAGWDREILAIELQALTDLDIDLDVTVTGFDMPEIDVLIGERESAEEEDPPEVVPEVDEGPAVSRPGDLWRIGKHRLLCGDATDPAAYARLLEGAAAQMIFTDPPYNVRIDGHVCGLGKVKHREFAMAAGEMSEDQFAVFLATVFRNLAAHSFDGAMHYICMDWRHLGEMVAAGRSAYTELKNLCVWAKTNGGMGSLYRSQHELIFVFKSGTGAHINNVELGRHGRYRTNVWSYQGVNSFGKDRDAELASHPTVKPVALVKDAILDCSRRGGIVLDVFAGSGTTLIAAEKTGRCGYGIELDPRYCDLIVRRLSAAAETEAIHAATGKTYAEIAKDRAAEAPDSTPGIVPPEMEADDAEG